MITTNTINELGQAILQGGNVQAIAKEYVRVAKEGFADSPILALRVKALEDLTKALKEELADIVAAELFKNGSFKAHGLEVSKFTSPYRYDFSSNQDWKAIEEQIKELKKKQKPIEVKMSTAHKNGVQMIDEETGEIYAPARVKSGGKESYRITKAK